MGACVLAPFLALMLSLGAAGCASRPALVAPDEIVLPQEAVPPGVRPLSRAVEEIAVEQGADMALHAARGLPANGCG